jgi:hypothetical protein
VYQTEQFSPTGGLNAVSISSDHWVVSLPVKTVTVPPKCWINSPQLSGATSKILYEGVTHGY